MEKFKTGPKNVVTESLKFIELNNMWQKINEKIIAYKHGGITCIYDEPALRSSMMGFLSDTSRSRYGGENFTTEKDYLHGLEWFMSGLKMFLEK